VSGLAGPGGSGADGVRLGLWPTPLQAADAAAGIYVKREDLCGFAFGGSKVRALEPVLAEARGRGARSIVTGGRRDSNWAALAAAAAAGLGLGCHCVLDPGPAETLAMALARRAGATLHMAPRPGKEAVNAMISSIARDLGPSAYAVPRAGATAGGVAGYCGLARELLEQMPSAAFDVVVAVGSGGACAGLLLGFEEAAGPAEDGDGVRVVGVPAGKTPLEAAQAVRRLARLARDRQLSQADPGSALRGLYIRGQAGARSGQADRIAASCGVLLDPVFAGPAWHAACAGPPGPGRPGSGRPVVLVASGGLPAYFDALAAAR